MPQFKEKMRIICNLGKVQVTDVEKGQMGTRFVFQLPGNVKIRAEMPIVVDVKIGDILTLYTEVLADELPQ